MYPYTPDLLQLQASRSSAHLLPKCLCSINTPLKWEAWELHLIKHPDLAFTEFILTGIKAGFRIGNSVKRKPAKRNYSHSDVVTRQLTSDCSQGFMIGPLIPADFPHIHMSRIGVIPKKHQAGKWRLIVDLSYPEGQSINDGIDSKLCSLSYVKIDSVVDTILYLGRGQK